MYLMVTLLFLKQKNKAFNFHLIFYKESIGLFKTTLSNGTKGISQLKMFIPLNIFCKVKLQENP